MTSNTPQYKAVWFWDEQGNGLNFQAMEKARSTRMIKRTFTCTDVPTGSLIEFLENVDMHQQRMYRNLYQRVVPQDVPSVVTLQDVKDVVTFLLVGNLPVDILALFHCHEINRLFRALIVYFQLYLQVREDLEYRRRSYKKQGMKHPISSVREARCRNLLSKLRSRIGQEYGHIITGEGVYRRYHHMNNPLLRSYSSRDMAMYEYLYKFSARLVWVALSRSNYKEIEIELANLIQYKPFTRKEKISKSDNSVLHGNKTDSQNHWKRNSPVISDIFYNKDDFELLAPKTQEEIFKDEMSGMDACLELPEELFHRFGLTLGILGESKDNYETMLQVKQIAEQSVAEQELEKLIGSAVEVVEQPYVKLKYLLNQLETPLHLNHPRIFEDNSFVDIKEEISFYLSNHMTDSRKSYALWKITKVLPS